MQPAVSICLIFIVISVGSLLTLGGIAIIALGSSGVFTPSKPPANAQAIIASTVSSVTTTISNTVSASTDPSATVVLSLNDASIYPNGSVSAALSSFTAASDTLALIPITQSVLDEIGGIENSSTIIEAGRLQYLYFHLPNDTSTASNQFISRRAIKQNADSVNSTRLAIGSNVITGVAIHFGAVSVSNSVVIVPIPNVSGTSNLVADGVFLYNLIDGSVVIRIDISVPPSLCPSSNGLPIDECLSISYQAYTVVNYNQITSALLVDVQLACGDVCSLSSSLCSASCTTCDGQQVAGFDTPVTRRYDMGSTVGTFQFTYETYTIQDRITVWNGAILLFDTGCVGAADTLYLNYSSTSSSIRVNVEPDCACPYSTGCGTAWYFIVSCLNFTTTSSRIITNNNQIASDNILKSSLSDKADIEQRLYTNRNNLSRK